jgi:GNAT superfamily N-acetyltransferase
MKRSEFRAGIKRKRMQSGESDRRFVLTLLDAPDQEAKAAAGAALYRYNVGKTGVDDRRPIGAKLSDSESGKALGGLWGRTELGVLFLDMFYLPEEIRGQSQGNRLLEAVEQEVRRRGCRRAVVETSSFQAPRFYERHGYQEFGRVDFALPGHSRVYLQKRLG